MLLGVYDYTVILTYSGMLTAYVGITRALHGDLHNALFCLMISGVCDMFDGKIASTKINRTFSEKRFGVQIDSLSDLICFGVLPAMITYTVSKGNDFSLFASSFYLLCALIRLAWFNVDEEERQLVQSAPRQVYYGLPVTTAALALPALMGLGKLRNWSMELVSPYALLIMGSAFLIPFPLKKPALLGKLGMLACGGGSLLLLLAGMDL